MNCFTTYCYCANFGNLQTGEASRDFGTRFAVTAGKTANNPANILIARERERERGNQRVTRLQRIEDARDATKRPFSQEKYTSNSYRIKKVLRDYSDGLSFPVLQRYNVMPTVNIYLLLNPIKTNMPMYTDK